MRSRQLADARLLWPPRSTCTLATEARRVGGRTLALDAPATAIAAAPDALCLLDDGTARSVRTVDPESGRTDAALTVGGLPGRAVFADDRLWLTIHAP